MKIYFVGMHHKEGLTALDSSTKSGKTIDVIISRLPQFECIKTNLCELEYMPLIHELDSEVIMWHERNKANKEDLIVLLGGWVQKNFLKRDLRTVSLPHPAAFNVFAKRIDYVENALLKILKP